jgi:hypothetical protein
MSTAKAFGLIILMLGGVCSNATAQNLSDNHRKLYVVDPKRPTVYISVEKDRRANGNIQTASQKRVFLRFNNNLRWGVRISVSPAKEGEGDARLEYDLLTTKDQVLESKGCHVCTLTIVDPGKGILFSVPVADLEGSNVIRINYSFAWESIVDTETRREPTHYVFFTNEK